MAHQERGSEFRRQVDRLLGMPLLWLFGLIKRLKELVFTKPSLPDPAQVRSIAAIKLAAIGDTVLLSAALARLRHAFPKATIHFHVGGSNAGVANMIPGIDEVREISIKNPFLALQQLRADHYDLMIDFEPWARYSPLLCCFSRSRFVAGFSTADQGRHWIFDRSVAHLSSRHELQNYMALVRELIGSTDHTLGLDQGTGSQVPEFVPCIGLTPEGDLPLPVADYVVFHLHSGGFLGEVKQWRQENWVALANRVHQKGLKILFTGTDENKAEIDAIIAKAEGSDCENIAGKYNLNATGHFLKHAEVVVSVNTGIMHLAAALDVPVLSLEGPTGPKRWGPIGKDCKSAISSHPGAGFLHLGFEYTNNPPDCMDYIDIDDVWTKLEEMLDD